MRIINVFDAAKEGTYKEFLNLLNGNINQINGHTGLNLLQTSVVNDKNKDNKKKIIMYLISNGVDINFTDSKQKKNALHHLFFNVIRSSKEYLLEVSTLLIGSGIDVNQTDKFGAIPLKYAITVNKLSTEDMNNVYRLLLESGSDYKLKDNFNKSCIDYASEYAWRNEFLELIKED